ncbi:MAG: ABC transporter ATP-binding protein [Acidobacteriota bacterium]
MRRRPTPIATTPARPDSPAAAAGGGPLLSPAGARLRAARDAPLSLPVDRRAPAPAALEVRDLRVSRGGSFTLEVPSLAVAAGETLAVIGVNGAGKSTLLEVLALLLKPDRGEVRIHGEAPSGRAARRRLRRRLGLALQDPFLLRGTILDNVALPLRLRAVPTRAARDRAVLLLQRFGVAHLAHRPSYGASGGEARRVSLARALVTDPDVLLLDEPFSALDPPTRDVLLRDFQRALSPGTAVVLVTHDRSEALSLAQQVAVLHAGRLLQWGPAQEVFRRPEGETVAALVGLESILCGPVVSSGGGVCRVEVAEGVTIEVVAEAEPGSRVTLCIHPEEVAVERPGPIGRSTVRNIFPAVVRSVTRHGHARRVELECPFPLVALVARRSVEELGLAPGASVAAGFKASAVRLFPARCAPA